MQQVTTTNDTTFSFVETWIEELLARWPEKDVKRVISERVPVFVERVLREIDSRRTNRVQIAQLVDSLYEDKCFSRFLYNTDSGAFYEVQSNGHLQRKPSDFLLMQLIPYIPTTFHAHRYQILRSVKSKMTALSVLEWTPPAACVNRVIADVQHNFTSLHEAQYFMTIVGGIVTRQEDVLLENRRIHLWHGPRVQEVIECVQQQLHRVHRIYSSFWNKVKRRMHHGYSLANVWALHFPPTIGSYSLRSIQQTPELFFAVAAYCYRSFPMNTCWETHPSLRPTYIRNNAHDLITAYLQSNVTIYTSNHVSSESNSVISHVPNYLLLREIASNYYEWLSDHRPVLPLDILTKQDFMQHIDTHIPQESTLGSKTLYCGSLQVGAAPTVHDLFRRFCQETLRVCSAFDATQQPPTVSSTEKNGTLTVFHENHCDSIAPKLSTRQLHNNYIVWCRHYATTLTQDDDGATIAEMPVLTDTHAKPWYCSYKLFEAFVERTYTDHSPSQGLNKRVPTTPRWNVQVVPHKDTWKYYLHQFEQCGTTTGGDDAQSDLGKWVEAEYGIQISDVTGNAMISNTSSPAYGPSDAPELDASDMESIIVALNGYQ